MTTSSQIALTDQLLTTKLHIPASKPEHVPRPQLIERLSNGLHHRLTLISAPAGFGKTTLLGEWTRRLQLESTYDGRAKYRTAWLSLDESDDDPIRLLVCIVAAIQRADATFVNDTASTLRSPQPPPTETILASLVNEIADIADKLILLLDDYHLIDSVAVHETVAFLLDHQPAQMHLVISTREDPQLPVPRLRALGELTELRATDLRFASAEVSQFLKHGMGLDLRADDIDALEARTEGWIAGLQLAAISIQGHTDAAALIKSFTGSHRFVLDYLIDEVLQQQPADLQDFLLQTAVLDRLTASLCDAITGQTTGQATLERLEQSNLFIFPLDEERHWYRYHHLFADLLRRRLELSQQEHLSSLHHQASLWYEQQGFIDQAINHALRGSDFVRAAVLIEDHFGSNYERAGMTRLQRWLAAMPDRLVCSRTDLCILQAWSLFNLGELSEAERCLQQAQALLAEKSVQDAFTASDTQRRFETVNGKLAGRIAAIRSFMASYPGDLQEIIRRARQALEYLPEEESAWRTTVLLTLGDAYAGQGEMVAAHQARSDALATGKASGDASVLMIVELRLAEVLRQQGRLQEVVEICQREFQRANESGIAKSPMVGWLLTIWGEVSAELNELQIAHDLAKKGVELAIGRDMLFAVWCYLNLIRVLFSSGDLAGTQEAIHAMQDFTHDYNIPLDASHRLSAWQARLWLEQGNLEAARRWIGERVLDPDQALAYPQEVEYIVYSRILMAQHRQHEAANLLQRLQNAAQAGGRVSTVIELLLLTALNARSGSDVSRAMSALERALTLAAAGGFIRTFVDEGAKMAELLYQARSRGIQRDYVQRLLTSFPDTELQPTDISHSRPAQSDWTEPLSERETEVLQLIAEGLTNQEIADRFFLSPNTVKVHTRNIYGKLDVHHRASAVAKARTLGMLTTD